MPFQVASTFSALTIHIFETVTVVNRLRKRIERCLNKEYLDRIPFSFFFFFKKTLSIAMKTCF